jgi:hypothetical protein
MMARSVRRNGTALSGRWKLGGEANRRKEEENGRQMLVKAERLGQRRTNKKRDWTEQTGVEKRRQKCG